MPKRASITLQQIKARVDNKVFERGRQYYDQGAISHCVLRGAKIEAQCQGSYPQPYQVWVQFDGSKIAGAGCTCEYGLTWGGDCKHIVALLLTYLHKPERFDERPILQDALASRSKEDLIEIIEQMIAAYPDLQRIVDRPTVREVVEGVVTLDEAPLRRELQAALEDAANWEWGDTTAADKVYELTDMGDGFAKRGDYQHALAIYCLILETCNAHDDPGDDEGEYIVAINDVIDHLDNTIGYARLGEQDALRRRVVDALLGAYFWDLDSGGIGYGEGCESVLLGILTQEDIPYVRQQLEAAMRDPDELDSDWWRDALEELQTELDRIDETDPEETLERLRNAGLHHRQIEVLLSLQRVDEAIAVARDQIRDNDQLIHALGLLSQSGQHEAAAAIAEKRLGDQYDWRLVNWLLDYYAQCGDHAKLFELQLRQMQTDPGLNHYLALKATAQHLGTWDSVRPGILAQLAEAQYFEVLIQAHLDEHEWALAWDILPKAKESQIYGIWYSNLEFEVAKKTRHVLPERAIPVYMRAARDLINERKRDSYARAAQLLVEVREMYRRMDDLSSWDELIAGLRSHLKSLRALQDELNQAGL